MHLFRSEFRYALFVILPFFSQYGPKSDVFRNVPKWYFSFRRWYFFSVKWSLGSVFWNFFFKKKISQKKISLFTFFIYKIVISEFAKTEKVEKKSWFATRIWCDFFFFLKYDHFWILIFAKKNIIVKTYLKMNFKYHY